MGDGTDAFSGLAAGYHAYRPRYPDALIEALAAQAITRIEARAWPVSALLVDVGCGTGILTFQLAERLPQTVCFLGVEPNSDMREAARRSAARPNIVFVDGLAEQIPVSDAAACMVMAAQAVQWFDRPAFYRESRRVLRKSGLLAIIQNNRDWSNDRFLECYEALLEELSPGYSRFYRSFDLEKELKDAGFTLVLSPGIGWRRAMTREEFRGMSLSSTKMQKAVSLHGEARIHSRLDELINAHFGASPVLDVSYRSELYLAALHVEP